VYRIRLFIRIYEGCNDERRIKVYEIGIYEFRSGGFKGGINKWWRYNDWDE